MIILRDIMWFTKGSLNWYITPNLNIFHIYSSYQPILYRMYDYRPSVVDYLPFRLIYMKWSVLHMLTNALDIVDSCWMGKHLQNWGDCMTMGQLIKIFSFTSINNSCSTPIGSFTLLWRKISFHITWESFSFNEKQKSSVSHWWI